MFENSFTAEEKLQELLFLYGAGEIHDCSDGVHWSIGNSPKKCIIVFHKEAEDSGIISSKNIRVELFPDYEELRKNKFFVDCLKNDCLEGGCWERLGKLYDWVERGTEDNAPHPADMWYSNAIETIEDNATWYLEDDTLCDFEIGDVVTDEDNGNPFIFAGKYYDKKLKQIVYKSYGGLIDASGELTMQYSTSWCHKFGKDNIRIAYKAEKKLLLDKLNEEGYTWDKKNLNFQPVPKVKTFKTGDLILVRNKDTEEWLPVFFGRYTNIGAEQHAQIIDTNQSAFSQYIKYDEKLAYTTENY